MTDEEKNAIEVLKEAIELYNDECLITTEDDFKSIEILLNLIEKQSKEIEEYNKQLDLDYVDKHYVPIERYNQLEKEIEELKQEKEYLNCIIESDKDNYINKDKIKAKIEELEKQDREDRMSHNYLAIPVLQSLLEKE